MISPTLFGAAAGQCSVGQVWLVPPSLSEGLAAGQHILLQTTHQALWTQAEGHTKRKWESHLTNEDTNYIKHLEEQLDGRES